MKDQLSLSWPSTIQKALLLAILYFLLGKSSLLLAIPPGYATAIWPSAGFALGFAMLYGPKVAIGAWIGSFLLNLGVGLDNLSTLTLQQIMVAATIGAGAYLHAALCGSLLSDKSHYPDVVEGPREIFRVAFVGGILGALITASVGTLTLYFIGLIPYDNLMINFFTWWVGDAIGVILLAPLVILYVKRHRNFFIVAPAVSAAALLVIMFYIFASRVEQRNIQQAFNSSVNQILDQINDRFDHYEEILTYFGHYVEHAKNITRSDFRSYAQKMFGATKSLEGVGWFPLVRDAQREAFVKEMRAEGFTKFDILYRSPDGEIKSSPRKDIYFPAKFLEPLTETGALLGYDPSYDEQRAKALKLALEMKKHVALGPINLIRSRLGGPGILIFSPVYHEGMESGFISGGFAIRNLIEEAIQSEKNLGVEFILRSNNGEVLYQSSARAVEILNDNRKREQLALYSKRELKIDPIVWNVEFFKSNEYLLAHRSLSTWFILAGGMLFSSLFGIMLLVITGQRARVQRLVDLRTTELVKVSEEVKKVTKLKEEFFANMSHEIRTPLNGIIGAAHLLMREKTIGGEGKRWLGILKSCSDTLLALINDILDFSKINEGKILLEKRAFEFQIFMNEVIAIFTEQTLKKKLVLELEVHKSVPAFILTDEVRLRQILMNLLSNSLKFTSEGTITVRVTYQAEKEQRGKLCFSVEDTGIGISKEAQKEIFSSFTQADASTTRKFGGTGLGLAISKSLCELLGGTISVESELGVGSKFSFCIEVDEVLQSSRKSGPAYDIDKENLGRTHPLKILLVEDNEINRELGMHILAKIGYSVSVAANGQEAIEQVSKQEFDLIFMDMQMPVMDGIEATRIIRGQLKNFKVKIIAMTANAFEDDRDKCLQAGMNDFISKPVNAKKVRQILIDAYQDLKGVWHEL